MDDTLANRLVQARSLRGWSQMDLASSSGVAAAQISRYESGRSKPRTEIVARLAKALEVHFEWLLSGSEERAAPTSDTKAQDASLNQEGARLVRVADPIDINPAQLQQLAVQLVGFHSERSALQLVVERLTKVQVDASALNGIERQLAAVEADILDTQEEIRTLVK